MQSDINENPKRNIFSRVLFSAIVGLCFALFFSGIGDKKIGQFLLASCHSVMKGITSLKIPSGSWQCPSSKILVDFKINCPFKENVKGRFWYSQQSNQWLMWGSPSEPEADCYVNVAWKKTPDQYTGNLRLNIRKMKTFGQGRITVSSHYKSVDVHHGMFEVLPFVFRDQSLVKKCLGFTNKQRDNRVLIRGWLCAEYQSTPSFEKLQCLLSSLAINGILEQDHSSNWCLRSVHQRQS